MNPDRLQGGCAVDRKLVFSRFAGGWIFLCTLLVCAAFLLASHLTCRIGFPLDDAWIHQTFARNLARYGEWSYIPGQVTSGSTSPLWTVLLSVGHLLHLSPFVWAFLLGAGCLCGVAFLGEGIFRSQTQTSWRRLPVMGLFLAGEWHLVWGAVSGMETLLFAICILAVFYLLFLENINWLLVGLLIGVSVWVRPDGLTLLGPALFVLLFSRRNFKDLVQQLAIFLLGFCIVFAPYLVFNRLISGNWMPNTYYAKQAEYAVLIQKPLLARIGQLVSLPMVGGGVLLLPGAFFALYLICKERRWALASAAIWWLGYTFIYASRLPVVYQHGRYLIPAMPVYFILGGIGTARLAYGFMVSSFVYRVIKQVLQLSIIAVWLAFMFMGARAYAQDVAIIESEMVDVSRWIAEHTDADAVVAAHDIGALGYFGERRIIDLAGLISPEVIPFIRDEVKLKEYLDANHVDYLVTFPGWYPILTKSGKVIYTTEGKYSIRQGGENMHVYYWE